MSLLVRETDPRDPLDAEIRGASSGADALEAVARHVRRCVLCDLHEHRVLAVPGEGDPQAQLMLVGEGPGRFEDAAGKPFVGKSGELLNDLLAAASLTREKLFITSIVKCRPVRVVEGKLRNRAPARWEMDACRPYLVRQTDTIRPAVIVCLGASAARGVIDPGFDLAGQRGKWFAGPRGSRIIATYHPAYAGRWGGAIAAGRDLKGILLRDIKKARNALT